MIITDTKKSEKAIIELYYRSIKKKDDEEKLKADRAVKLILICFQLISIFTNEDHTSIVKQIYFSKKNIQTLGILKTAYRVHMHPNTLYSYRQKYCAVINSILASIDTFNDYDYYKCG